MNTLKKETLIKARLPPAIATTCPLLAEWQGKEIYFSVATYVATTCPLLAEWQGKEIYWSAEAVFTTATCQS